MNLEESDSKLAIQRLTALWALNESGLGGLLHLFNTPFTGLFVGALAILIISLIGYFSGRDAHKNILKAMFIVMIVKVAVSPHSQFTAYIAVTFQAFLGILLFKLTFLGAVRWYIFGVIGLVESALQKLLTLTLLYGNSLWESLDSVGQWLAQKGGYLLPVQSSKLLIILYLIIYIIGGFILGFVINNVIAFIQDKWRSKEYVLSLNESHKLSPAVAGKKKKRPFALFVGVAIIIFGIFTFISPELSGFNRAIYMIIRAMIIIAVWYLLLAPVLLKLTHRYLLQKKGRLSHEVEQVFDLLPYMRYIVRASWLGAQKFSWLKKWNYFIKSVILYSLKFRINNEDDLPH